MTIVVQARPAMRGRETSARGFSFQHPPMGDLTHPLMKQIFGLRYEVYCIECGYLSPEDYEDKVEWDEYDGRAFHVAAHGDDSAIAGTVRLVQAGEGQQFPFEECCAVFGDFSHPPRETCGEVSRLMMRNGHRRRRDGALGLLGMYRQLYRHSRKVGIRYWYAAMEPGLAASLAKLGFHFVAIGPETDYYGRVTPYVVDLVELEHSLRQENPVVHAWFSDVPMEVPVPGGELRHVKPVDSAPPFFSALRGRASTVLRTLEAA